MLTHRYYESLEHIEPEFQIILENLLLDEIPSWNWLVNYQALKDNKKIKTFIYLFFDEDKSFPIGLTQINLIETPKKLNKKWKVKFLNTLHIHHEEFILSNKIEGLSNHSSFFHPIYAQEGPIYVKELLEKFKSQYNIALSFEQSAIKRLNTKNHLTLILNNLISIEKKHSTYNLFLNSLSPKIHKRLKKLWYDFNDQPSNTPIKIKYFHQLISFCHNSYPNKDHHHIFQYINIYRQDPSEYIIFGSSSDIQAIIILIPGKRKNLFVDILINQINDFFQGQEEGKKIDFLIHYTIKYFFGFDNYNRLSFLSTHNKYFIQRKIQHTGLTKPNNYTFIESKSYNLKKNKESVQGLIS